MQALQFSSTGNLDALALRDLPVPKISADEVLVQVRAAGMNPSDLKNVLGRFPYTTLPRTPGRDFAGVIVEGPGQWLGREVWGSGKGFGFTRDGSHAEYLTLPIEEITIKPQALSFAQAASCGVPYITAWDALERAAVGAATSLLIMGFGAVARAAYDFAKIRGARTIVAVRRDEQVALLRAQGIETIQLQSPEPFRAALNAVFPEGPEVILESTGHLLPVAIDVLKTFGRIAVIAAPPNGLVETPVLSLYRRGGSIVGTNTLLYSGKDGARLLDQIAQHFDSGALPPPADFMEQPLDQALAVYRAVNAGSSEKIVFNMG